MNKPPRSVESEIEMEMPDGAVAHVRFAAPASEGVGLSVGEARIGPSRRTVYVIVENTHTDLDAANHSAKIDLTVHGVFDSMEQALERLIAVARAHGDSTQAVEAMLNIARLVRAVVEDSERELQATAPQSTPVAPVDDATIMRMIRATGVSKMVH